MIRRISARCPRQRLSTQFQPALRFPPLVRLPGHGIPNPSQRARIGLPHSARQKTLPGLEMQIQPRRVHRLTRICMPEVHANMRLVWTLVFRKANVPIDPKQRTAVRLGIRQQPRADFTQAQAQVGDETKAGLAGEFFEFLLVLEKPRPPVISAQLFPETEIAWE